MKSVDESLIHRLFYPQVPAVLSTAYRGRVSAMPVVSYASVSDHPPIVAVGCAKGGYTLELATKSKAFSLCLLSKKHVRAVAKLASTSGRNVADKLGHAGLKHERGKKVNAPIIVDADATLECSLKSKSEVGDHVLLFGLVKAAYASESFGELWDFSKYSPILYTGWTDGLTTYREN